MNFLAHAYLSFNDDDLLIGNMISDYVKGKKQYDYSPRIHHGITLHRSIDNYTDIHPIVKSAKAVFQPYYRLYAGAFIDIVFDHFLAIDKKIFPEGTLESFSNSVYSSLQRSFHGLPEVFQQIFPYMKQHNWLLNYRSTYGIERSFRGLVQRSRYMEDSKAAVNIFHEEYSFLQKCYDAFFPAVEIHAREYIKALNGPGSGTKDSIN